MEPPRITLTGAQDPEEPGSQPQPSHQQAVTGSLASVLSPKIQRSRTHSVDEDDDRPPEFRLFDRNSFAALIIRERDYQRRVEERRLNAGEGRLVEGEIKFDEDPDAEEDKIKADPQLADGCTLPLLLNDAFPNELQAKPIQEIDKHIRKRSFVVINTRFRRKYIYRFSANAAFYCLPPWSPVRKAFVYLATNQFLDYFLMLTILANCICLAIPNDTSMADNVFMAIYTFELIVKMVARGLILDSYTYLRDPWNWLDLIVLLISYVMLILQHVSLSNNVNVGSLRTFRVFRVLKTITIFPGMKTIISALLGSFRMLIEVIILTLFCMAVFALVALQVYMGTLRNKCVLGVDWSVLNGTDPMDNSSSIINEYYVSWVQNSSNWLQDNNGEPVVCGNVSGSGRCENLNSSYVCLPEIGINPNWGYTNFDNFGWCLMSIFQLITLDHWEDLYNLIIRTNGTWNIIFFILIVFFGSFYLVNLMLAVVTMRYEEQAVEDVKAREREKVDKKRKSKQRHKTTDYKFDPQRLKRKRKKQSKAEETTEAAAVAVAGESAVEAKTEAEGAPLAAAAEAKENGVVIPHPEIMVVATAVPEAAFRPTSAVVVEAWADPARLKSADPGSRGEGPDAGEAGGDAVKAAALDDKPDQRVVSPTPLQRTPTRETLESVSQGDSQAELGDAVNMLYEKEQPEDVDGEQQQTETPDVNDRNCPCCSRCCHNYPCWLKFQDYLYNFAMDPFFELFIVFCILMNTLFMATEHYPMSESYESMLGKLNYIFTAVFTTEAVIKITAMSKRYFQSGWNVFDLIVVIASLIDVGVEDVKGLSIFRTFRLFRVFRLAQSWETMRKLLVIIFSTLGAVGNLSFVLFIIVFIFAVIGNELFQGSYTEAIFGTGDNLPRWNFEDFTHSMLMVFRVLCGEWIEASWDCMRAKGQLCVVVFIPSLVLGRFMVLNLFLALLLNSFSNEAMG